MPASIDLLLIPISLIAFGLYAAWNALEAIAPGRELPNVRAWPLRGLAAFAVVFLLSSDLPVFDMLFGTLRNAPSYAPATGSTTVPRVGSRTCCCATCRASSGRTR